MRIGNSFSPQDIRTAIDKNAAEMRAVTPTYTFSIKRPKGGWGVSPNQAVKIFNQISRSVTVRNDAYVMGSKTYKDVNERAERASVTHYHVINREFAKRIGANYTKKNR